MPVYLGCIADDFTGATDLAGLLARNGSRVSLRIGVPKASPIKSETSDYEVIALKCRSSIVKEALSETSSALSWLKSAGAQKLFWKYCSTFDSTDNGNIGPVAESLMEKLGVEQTIFCPAFPENDRNVFMGNLFVGDQLLSESSMKDHPINPMRDSNLIRLLDAQTNWKVGLANHLVIKQGVKSLQNHVLKLKERKIQHIIVDAISNNDLYVIAQAFFDWPLITGGSAIAEKLSNIYNNLGLTGKFKERVSANKIDENSIVLSGSCSLKTREQISKYLREDNGFKLDPIEISEKGLDEATNWLIAKKNHPNKIIYSCFEKNDIEKAKHRLGSSNASKIIEDAMTVLAQNAFSLGIRRFVIAGGETSGAVINGLKISKLQIGSEISPGVPWTFASKDNKNLAFCLKSGNFGNANFFSEAFEKLENI